MLAGQLGKVTFQGAYFVVVARALGVDGFGAFAGAVAVVALLAPFGSLGAVNLMIRHIVNDPQSVAHHFSTALLVTLGAGCAMAALLISTAQWIAPESIALWALGAIAIADLLGARIVDLAGGVWIARESMGRTAGYQLELNGLRVFGALALWASPLDFTLETWALVYLGTSVAATASVLARVLCKFGLARPRPRQYFDEWRDGMLFAFSLASQSVYNDVDKAMLARLSTLEATGVYTAAYRVVDLAFVPMRAILGAAYPRFFREGAKGLGPALVVAKQLAVPGVGYCFAASLLLLAGADIVPVVLGPEYEESVAALRALALIPFIRGVHYLAADALTGSAHQGRRSVMQLVVALTNVGLNFVLIPKYGYWGAVVSSLVADGLLALLLWLTVAVTVRMNRRSGVACGV